MDIVTDIQKLRVQNVPIKETNIAEDLAETLFREMKEHNAQGLAANQLGIHLMAFVMKREGYGPTCIVNPTITGKKGKQESNETCLSLPGIKVWVVRPMTVKIKGVNQYLVPVSYHFHGVDARRACHEIDHLFGKLIIDYKEESNEQSTMPILWCTSY